MRIIPVLCAVVILLYSGCAGPVPSHLPTASETGLSASDRTENAGFNNGNDIQRKIISSAEIRINTTAADSVHARVLEIANTNNGYMVKSENDLTQIRIPAGEFAKVLEEIETLGEVISKNMRGKDITDEYHDLEIRLDNAEKTRQRYLALLDKAETIEEILSIERELERLNNEIELLKGKLERLSHLVEYATITVRTDCQIRPGPVGYVFYQMYNGVKWLFVRD